jgi:hypothetical protein
VGGSDLILHGVLTKTTQIQQQTLGAMYQFLSEEINNAQPRLNSLGGALQGIDSDTPWLQVVKDFRN